MHDLLKSGVLIRGTKRFEPFAHRLEPQIQTDGIDFPATKQERVWGNNCMAINRRALERTGKKSCAAPGTMLRGGWIFALARHTILSK